MVTEYVPDLGISNSILAHGKWATSRLAGGQHLYCPRKDTTKNRLAVVVPVTNAIKGYPFGFDLPAGVKIGGKILSDTVRSIDWGERHSRYFDKAPAEVLKDVQASLAALLSLPRL